MNKEVILNRATLLDLENTIVKVLNIKHCGAYKIRIENDEITIIPIITPLKVKFRNE